MKKLALAFTMCLFALGCSSDSDGDGNGGGNGNQNPAVQSLPANNSECTTGISVNDIQSKVTFEWSAAEDTETYFVYVKNLDTQNTLQYSAGANTTTDILLSKGTPYSWYVTAKKTSGTSVSSEVWKFYNAGNPVSSHAPFAADVVAPVMSSTVTGPTITLQWTTSDIDNDIKDYTVYMDGNTNPATVLSTVTTQTVNNVAVTAGTYYWKVVTTDKAGNATPSPVFQFKVN